MLDSNIELYGPYVTDSTASGGGFPPKNELKRTSNLSGCENGASCAAPLMVAKDSISPYTCVHPVTCLPSNQTLYGTVVFNSNSFANSFTSVHVPSNGITESSSPLDSNKQRMGSFLYIFPVQVNDDQIILDMTVADQVSIWKSSRGLTDKVVPNHDCSGETCSYYQIGDVFVCEKTGQVHVCDDTCREAVLDPTNVLLVCTISGHCFDLLLSPSEMEPDTVKEISFNLYLVSFVI